MNIRYIIRIAGIKERGFNRILKIVFIISFSLFILIRRELPRPAGCNLINTQIHTAAEKEESSFPAAIIALNPDSVQRTVEN